MLWVKDQMSSGLIVHLSTRHRPWEAVQLLGYRWPDRVLWSRASVRSLRPVDCGRNLGPLQECVYSEPIRDQATIDEHMSWCETKCRWQGYRTVAAKLACPRPFAAKMYDPEWPVSLPFGGEKNIVLIFNVNKKFMLKFKHFWKFTPEMYPLSTPFLPRNAL